jgi:hypothetical protein
MDRTCQAFRIGIGIGVEIVAVCDNEGPARWRAVLRVPASSIGFPEERAGCVGLCLGGHDLSEHGRESGGEGEQAGERDNEDGRDGPGHAGRWMRCASQCGCD